MSIVEDADGNQLIDSDGHLIQITDLEKAVHQAFAESGGRGKGGDLHEEQGVLDVVESFVVTAEKREALGFGEGPAGWISSFRVSDDDVWAKIKNGDRPELSLRGSGKSTPLKKRHAELTKVDNPILITDIELNKLEWFSTVDRGASGDDKHRPAIVLWKRAQLTKQEQSMPTLEESLAKLSDEEKAVVMEALKAASAPAPQPAPVAPAAPVPLAQRKDIPEDVKIEMAKRDEDAKKAETERVEMAKRVADLEDRNARIEIAKRVRETMQKIPGDEGELVDLIKRITDLDHKKGEAFEKRLVSLAKAMEESPLLKAMGSSAIDVNDNSAEVELKKRAEELRKTKPEMTEAGARQKVLADTPGLYERLRDEQTSAA